ncbi:hypothetical protein ACQEVF_04200 [Nonomuraea polychroma]|uniref:hypothetical protein n=1 Tax=Nonomuraea polychroma TaxID=46176 RepID=UPI003D8E0E69
MATIVERYNVPKQHFWLHGPRTGQPVEYDADTGLWSVYGYPELQEVLGDPATFSSDTMRVMPKGQLPDDEEISLAGFITQIDPPEHGKLRKLVSSAFTRKVVADLEPRIAALTRELLDAARERARRAGRGRADRDGGVAGHVRLPRRPRRGTPAAAARRPAHQARRGRGRRRASA